MSTENALLTILVEKIKNDTLVLPTLPAIALKVRKAADDPDINLNAMADVISQDPSLSARMIKISNSAYLGRTVKVNSVTQAVHRIGLRQVKNIATALAMEQLYVSKNDVVKTLMAEEWDKTVKLVTNAMACLQLYYDRTGKKELSLDAMTLAALVSNIGVLPILTEAERHEQVFANPTFLKVATAKLAGVIGSKILKSWEFDESFIQIAEKWQNLEFLPDQLSYIDFVRLGAMLAGQLGNQKDAIANLSMMRDVVDDLNELQSDKFIEMRENAKVIFS